MKPHTGNRRASATQHATPHRRPHVATAVCATPTNVLSPLGDQSTLEISSTPRYGGSGGESEKKERVKLEQFELGAEGLVGGGGGGMEGWMAVERKGREICSDFNFFLCFVMSWHFFLFMFLLLNLPPKVVQEWYVHLRGSTYQNSFLSNET
ncbi:transmembrane protein, putative [Medicago truncatula]|uniref:Transmembrane protein, putative n=1 Tax=Medicago truncatula TaxID=3880 RepID=G7JJ50_MEDTR|nr:transmembrane protein, putative [Medicago truncatula]